MFKQGLPEFPYFVGIDSLAQIATRRDQVCVLNILGNESRSTTPISHAYSGGNVVFGTAPGHQGATLETTAGDIPVFDNVRDGLNAGYHFNTGVVYLPPAAVRHGVYELVRVNPEVKKIVIITEKVPVHDARAIRAVSQQLGIDVLGANCLGVADSWNQVRIGGALGGDRPAEALQKGSIAIFSNSGNFTTTLASYLLMSGWGTTTLVSSGKDHYIHYAAPEWAHALKNDQRTRAAVMYVEPGGYYERDLKFPKPIVACVVGKWKEKLTRPVGHAGAIAGSGDGAGDKEGWFKAALDVDELFTPERPVCSPKGAVVNNIAHVPAALSAVMNLHRLEPDFEPRGSLKLKPWFGNEQGLALPEPLRLPVVDAIRPYADQIDHLNERVGVLFPRESMKDASGASRMDPDTQVTSVHGMTVLNAGRYPFESNLCHALLREPNDEPGNAVANAVVIAWSHLHGDPMLDAATAARDAGNAPSTVLSAAVALLGPKRLERARAAVDLLIGVFAPRGLDDPFDGGFDLEAIDAGPLEALGPARATHRGAALLAALGHRSLRPVFVEYLRRRDLAADEDLLLGALALTLAWRPLRRRRISRTTARNLPWFLQLYGALLGASIPSGRHEPERLLGRPLAELLAEHSVTDLVIMTLTDQRPSEPQRVAIQMLLGLLISNGPGTISAQGAKGAVSADGPETPDRVQLNKAMIGFLTHSGYSHGGNGYEGIRFLLDRFASTGLADPSDPDHGIDLSALAQAYARQYGEDKSRAKSVGERVRAIPGVNHPVYRGRPVNIEPREAFIADFFKERGEYNVFHEFYRALVQALFGEGVTRNVFAVNIDAVISSLLLKMIWGQYRSGALTEHELEEAAFNLFLYGRMVGCAAEVDDHVNRGRNMDTRTPASKCRAVS